jgi:hypothetical protein
VAAPFKGGFQENIKDLKGQTNSQDPPAHAKEIGIVMEPAHPRGIEIEAQHRPNSGMPVGGHGHPNAGSAYEDSPLAFAFFHATGHLMGNLGVVNGFPVESTDIRHPVGAELLQVGFALLFQVKSGVVGSNDDVHEGQMLSFENDS